MASLAQGTAGYAEAADTLAQQYESITFADIYADLLRFVPEPPARALDIGAGTGRDAAALAALGHKVLAVEPTAELRAHGQRLHPEPAITWIDDVLPDLAAVRARAESFDLILLTAVWMHLDESERREALPHIADLLSPGGCLFMTLRHGPVPPGRRMFEVSAQEVANHAGELGLSLLAKTQHGDMLGRAGVCWTVLALRKG
jgi:SAM-dependent methyltransferase